MKRWWITAACSLFLSIASADSPHIAAVDLFVAVDCPIANAYAPEFNRLQNQYASRGIRFRLVYPDTALSEKDLQRHKAEYSLLIEQVIDFEHILVNRAGATITPEAALFDAGGALIYRGRIDDLFTDLGDRRRAATEVYLRDQIEALLRSEEVPFSEIAAVGCYIEPISD